MANDLTTCTTGNGDLAEIQSKIRTGASLKDAGRLTFAVIKSGPETISGLLENLRKATKSSVAYG